MKKVIEPYYVINWDFNKNTVEYYDIMPYLIREYKEEKKRKNKVFATEGFETFETCKYFILRASKYQFWSRCEYEILVSGFPPVNKQEKIDVYDQVEHNIDIITNHFMLQINK